MSDRGDLTDVTVELASDRQFNRAISAAISRVVMTTVAKRFV